MKRIFPVLLALCLLLCACGEKEAETAPHTAPGEEHVFAETAWTSSAYCVENISESIFGGAVISKMCTNLEISNYINTYGTLVDLSALELETKYDDAFFENNSLVFFLLDTDSPSCIPEVTDVSAMGIVTDINVTVSDGDGSGETATWLVIVETERSVYDSDVYVYIY